MAAASITAKAKRPQFTCERCDTIFSVPPSRAPARYCSQACCAEHRRTTGIWPHQKAKRVVACGTCGKEFRVVSSSKARFCSQACMLKWRAPVMSATRSRPESKTEVHCQWCDTVFVTYWCKIRAGRGKFCSRQCRAAHSARRCQNRVSVRETEFGNALAESGLAFERQRRLGRWTVDFYFRSIGLAVEFDGEYWHSLPSAHDRDNRKEQYLKKRGVVIARVPERLWLDHPAAAIELVRNAVHARSASG